MTFLVLRGISCCFESQQRPLARERLTDQNEILVDTHLIISPPVKLNLRHSVITLQ